MSDKPINPLRQRMIDDMTARRYSEKVQKAYVRHVRTFAAFLGQSPDTATSDDLRRFQLHMAQQQISPVTSGRCGERRGFDQQPNADRRFALSAASGGMHEAGHLLRGSCGRAAGSRASLPYEPNERQPGLPERRSG